MNQDSQPEIEGLRQSIARIFDPEAWTLHDWPHNDSGDPWPLLRTNSLAKADAVLALLSLKEGGGLASCTDSAASVASQPDCSEPQSFAGSDKPIPWEYAEELRERLLSIAESEALRRHYTHLGGEIRSAATLVKAVARCLGRPVAAPAENSTGKSQ